MNPKLSLTLILISTICTKSSDVNESAQLIPSNGASYFGFGYGVGIYGDYSIIGAPNAEDHANSDLTNAGIAYIFKKNNNNNNWAELIQLTSSDIASYDGFGFSVSIYDKYVIVGSPQANNTGNNQGAAYIFKRIHDSWLQTAKLIASDATNIDNFGYTVSIKGEYALIGTINDKSYIFKINEDESWSEMALLTPSNDTDTRFGNAVCLDEGGNYAVIGASRDNDVGSDAGAVYIFAKDSDETWSEISKLTSPDPGTSYYFGGVVSMDGNYIIIGESSISYNKVYIYKINKINNEIELNQVLNIFDDYPYELYSVYIQGNYLLIGGQFYYGRVGLYLRNNITDNWDKIDVLLQSDGGSLWDYFGSQLAMYGTDIIIAAPRNDNINGDESGTAYIYKITPHTLEPTIQYTTSSPTDIDETTSSPANHGSYHSTLLIFVFILILSILL